MHVIIGSTDASKRTIVENTIRNIIKPSTKKNKIHITCKDIESSVQPINLDETKQIVLNNMISCYPTQIQISKYHHTFCIGIENGLILGTELNEFEHTNKYYGHHGYNINMCAVTVFKGGTFYKFVSYVPSQSLSKDKDRETSLISPDIRVPDENTVDALSAACVDAFKKLNNIHPFDIHSYSKKNIVIMFGTFDLFHDLHRRLIDHACLVGNTIVIYIYGKSSKRNFKNNTKTKIYDDVQKRISIVTKYALTKTRNVVVKRMFKSHHLELKKAIQLYSKQGSISIMGGDDQFNEHYNIVKICSDMNTPIISLNRGETKLKLCSSDIREKMSYQKISQKYDLDFNNISPFFWKNRIRSSNDAKTYIQSKLKYLGLDQAEIWKFIPSSTIDKRIISTKTKNHTKIKNHTMMNKTILCLPGRTVSTLDRFRKIALTIQNDFVPQYLYNNVSIYVACYDQNNYDTEYHCKQLENNRDYFSDDAMIFTKLVIMPLICKGICIEKCEDEWVINTTKINIKSIDLIIEQLSNVTLFARSVGSVIAIEMENAFKYCMISLGFSNDDIVRMTSKISILTISNLASLDRPRLFNTVSVTGVNDKKAQKHIVFPENMLVNALDTNTVLSNKLNDTHLSIITTIPQFIIEIGSNKEIADNNCHYTPLYTALRQNESNAIPLYIRTTAKQLLNR